ncbi:hypothetical protein ACFPA8_07825 [Streptomyces ovatisporus]|uniref:Secreted protein n=1 Tax=Streptomyces ovatisporus TaxID=1128682 RepID=A0ABV9A280_9ACTN
MVRKLIGAALLSVPVALLATLAVLADQVPEALAGAGIAAACAGTLIAGMRLLDER